jgi:4'-phosphopantetheinyl transferase
MPAPALQTAPNGVRWLLEAAAGVPVDDAWLAPVERARLAQLRVAKRRADWRLGRWTGKRAVAAALGIAAERVAVIAAAGGAPLALLDGVPAPLAISLSHAGGRGLCAVAAAGVAVGCDLEVVAPRASAFAGDYFTAAEQVLAGGDPRRVTLVWCAKEAALKALGEGLREDPRAVEVALTGGRSGEWTALTVACAGCRLSGWARELDGLMAVIAVA